MVNRDDIVKITFIQKVTRQQKKKTLVLTNGNPSQVTEQVFL